MRRRGNSCAVLCTGAAAVADSTVAFGFRRGRAGREDGLSPGGERQQRAWSPGRRSGAAGTRPGASGTQVEGGQDSVPRRGAWHEAHGSPGAGRSFPRWPRAIGERPCGIDGPRGIVAREIHVSCVLSLWWAGTRPHWLQKPQSLAVRTWQARAVWKWSWTGLVSPLPLSQGFPRWNTKVPADLNLSVICRHWGAETGKARAA